VCSCIIIFNNVYGLLNTIIGMVLLNIWIGTTLSVLIHIFIVIYYNNNNNNKIIMEQLRYEGLH